jgi:hypothetical protein
MQEAHLAHTDSRPIRRGLGWVTWIAILATAVDVCSWEALGLDGLTQTARTLIALAPLVGNVTLLCIIVRAVRRLDEFQRRVRFEAVVIAFLATGVAVFIYGFLQKAQAVGALNMGIVWAFMVVFYILGYAISVRQYR